MIKVWPITSNHLWVPQWCVHHGINPYATGQNWTPKWSWRNHWHPNFSDSVESCACLPMFTHAQSSQNQQPGISSQLWCSTSQPLESVFVSSALAWSAPGPNRHTGNVIPPAPKSLPGEPPCHAESYQNYIWHMSKSDPYTRLKNALCSDATNGFLHPLLNSAATGLVCYWLMYVINVVVFPTCQVKVARFYVNSTPPRPPRPLPPSSAGPKQQALDRSGPRQTLAIKNLRMYFRQNGRKNVKRNGKYICQINCQNVSQIDCQNISQ